jgi:UDP-glucuronate 4-epimerase
VKTILVTGAAGFIGSHVAEALLRRGDRVIGLDNLSDFYEPARKRGNLAELQSLETAVNFRFVEADIRDRAALGKVFSSAQPEAIVHLAGMAGVRTSVDDPWLYYDVNLTGTLNLLDLAVGRGDPSLINDYLLAMPELSEEQRRELPKHVIARALGVQDQETVDLQSDDGRPNFVLASTSSVYGGTKTIPFVETDSADRPLAPYPASKRAAELLGHTYHHLYGLDFTALRFFTVYGPRNRPDMMAFKLLDGLRLDREVPFYNDGDMRRDWTFISDIVTGVVSAADRRLGYEVINLGRGEPVLLAEFVACMETLTGKRARLSTQPMPPADVAYTYANIEKAHELLGYAPKVSVAEGVRRLYEWYRRAVGEV